MCTWPLRCACPFYGGFLAVDFFFCLSGFVIAFAYEKRLAQGMRATDFMVARWIRLLSPLSARYHSLGLTFLTPQPTSRTPRSSLSPVDLRPRSRSPHVPLRGIHSVPPRSPLLVALCRALPHAIYAALMRLHVAGNIALTALAAVSFAVLYRSGAASRVNARYGHDRSSVLIGLARAGLAFPIGVLAYRLHAGKRSPA